MKIDSDNAWTRTIARLLAACALLLLSGCFITVTHFIGGSVSTDLGGDCGDGCIYQVNEGESFSRTFTAEPHAGNEFVRWKDSLGDNFSICKHPTQAECRIEINSLHPNLEGTALDVEAQFRAVTGYNVNNIQFVEEPNIRRVIRKINDDIWLEIYTPKNVAYYYRQGAAGNFVELYDKTRDFLFHFDLVRGDVRGQQGTETHTLLATNIVSLSARLNGLLVSHVAYGGPGGVHKGDYIQLDASTWVDRNSKTQADKNTYTEMKRDDSSVYLHDESRDVEIQLDILGGLIYSSANIDPQEPVAIIQRVLQPVSGWGVSEVSYTDDSGDILGYFTEQGGTAWVETAAANGMPAVNYELIQRDANVVLLLDSQNNIRVRLDLLRGVVTSQSLFGILTLDKYKIVEAK